VPHLFVYEHSFKSWHLFELCCVFLFKIAFRPKSFQGQIVTELSHEPIYLYIYPLGIILNINAIFFHINAKRTRMVNHYAHGRGGVGLNWNVHTKRVECRWLGLPTFTYRPPQQWCFFFLKNCVNILKLRKAKCHFNGILTPLAENW